MTAKPKPAGALSPKLARAAAIDGWRLEEAVGAGASGLVFRASRSDGASAAFKIARTNDDRARREILIAARAQRRWGPLLLAAGRASEPVLLPDGTTVAAGTWWSASSWIEGEALVVRAAARTRAERRRLALVIAHGVGRGLGELHSAGVRHGDVKPANIVVHTERAEKIDRVASRGATLLDLDLATSIAEARSVGGTPRYTAPEVASGEPPTPAADAYAFGLVLAEILFPALADAPRLDDEAVGLALANVEKGEREIASWITALVARAPGARPACDWIASRAARLLELVEDRDDRIADRRARVRRTYLAVRSEDVARGGRPHPAIRGEARHWLEEALRLEVLAAEVAPPEIAPLDPLGTARWLVGLVGPVAASWPVRELGEGALAERLLELTEVAPPEAWTLEEVASAAKVDRRALERPKGPELWIELARELGRTRPDALAYDDAEGELTSGQAPPSLAWDLASALLRRGETGRAFAAIAHADHDDPRALLLRAEIARRLGDVASATRLARQLIGGHGSDAARALLARMAWDRGDTDAAVEELGDASGAPAAEVRALLAYSAGEIERGLGVVDVALNASDGGLGQARLEGTRGMLEHARGNAGASYRAFERAVELAVRDGAVVEEATYLTGLAAAAVDVGATHAALSAATRAALLWERLDRRALAARAHLSRAAAYALIGATHEADRASHEAAAMARASNDLRAVAFARWAIVETRSPGDALAREEALAAAKELGASSEDDQLRAAARVLFWARDVPQPLAKLDDRASALSPTARWEWWGARASGASPSRRVLSELVALFGTPAPVGSRGPALAAAAALARAFGDGDVARRLEALRRDVRAEIHAGAPPEHRAALAGVSWLAGISDDEPSAFGTAQVGELEAIVRALSSRDRLKPLLEQVVDTMVLWTGVERGLLLLRAPDDRLVARAARNLARQDLAGEQLSLSLGLAKRAMAERDAICATDAFAQVGDLHASVHALGLRSVLAVPLIARGDVLGVVYLDDRVRRGAFGPGELAWVRLVASQAALAIADARDQTLLRRAVRQAERANARLRADLGRSEAELANVRAELAAGAGETRFRYDEIAGRSEPMRAMLKLVDRITPSALPVLIHGESGTGKELVARAIHRNGPRGQRAFVGENCASVPETLLESTLFGHVRGAFTGAMATRAGLFDVADGGTLFLDEIGEMPLSMQTKLLRVLQDGDVRPVGGERSRKVDVRIIAATHRDLEAMVAEGTFREDLFYRLNVVGVRVPALRERPDDIPLLVARFIEKYAGRKVKVTRAAMDRLIAFPWPGNVRQLENEVRRALVLADDRVDTTELSADVARGGKAATKDAGLGLKARVDALEAELVRDALKKTNNNQTRAAEALGISRFGLQKMMRRLGIRPAP